jgi:integrase
LGKSCRSAIPYPAFTGTSRSERRGLRWSDYHDGEIHVSRKLVNIDGEQYVGPTKTEGRSGGIPVIDVVAVALTSYRKQFPPMSPGDSIFRAVRDGKSLNLGNLVRCEIYPVIEEHGLVWKGLARVPAWTRNPIGA